MRRTLDVILLRTRARNILLGEFLSEEQKGELEQHGRFHVLGSKGSALLHSRASGQSRQRGSASP